MTAPWLKRVLRDLEGAIVLLVDAQMGRFQTGGTLEQQRSLAVQLAAVQIGEAERAYERQAATLSRSARKRAAALFGAAYALRERVLVTTGPDAGLAEIVRRCESVQN